jgi:SAM-dependent methyltransferase
MPASGLSLVHANSIWHLWPSIFHAGSIRHETVDAAMTVQHTDSRPPVPSSPEIAQTRLKAMRGERGVVGDILHWLGVRLGIAYNGSFYYPSEDRSVLENLIIPYYQLSPEHQRIVFVGTAWYTKGYNRMFARKSYTTMDPNPANRPYGAESHIVDVVGNLEQHVAPGSLDVIFLNGVVGWGLNERDDAETAFAACYRCLRKGGHFLIGWNDLAEHRPFRLEEVESLGKFQRLVFPPLDTSEYLIDNEWLHTFSFFSK